MARGVVLLAGVVAAGACGSGDGLVPDDSPINCDDPQVCAEPQAVCDYEHYRHCRTCDSVTGLDDKCLEPASFVGTRFGGEPRRVEGVYKWRDTEKLGWTQDDRGTAYHKPILPKALLPYLRRLREAYAADPAGYREPLLDMVEFMQTDAVRRGDALVWENRYGYAQALEQAEYASYFSSVARTFHVLGELELAGATLRLALDLLRALDTPVGPGSGGVRRVRGETCGPTNAEPHPCYWFHSRGRDIDIQGYGTVLHHHLRAIRDSLIVYVAVHDLPELISDPDARLDDAMRWAVGGLYQLSFALGNSTERPWAPPTLLHFMRWLKPPAGPSFYWAHYQFLMDWDETTGAGSAGVGVDTASGCRYHLDVLRLMREIGELLDHREHGPRFDEHPDAWRLREAFDWLMRTDANAPMGVPGSPHAVYEFFLTATDEASWAGERGCVGGVTDQLDCATVNYFSQRFGVARACTASE